MKIIVNGAGGRMGRALQDMIKAQGLTLAAAADPYAAGDGILPRLEDFTGQADIIIDFSNHQATAALVSYAVDKKLPLIIATTGHTEQELELIRTASKFIPIFHSGNMSLGIAVLTSLVRQAAAMFPEADIEIVEAHHNQKLDVPSGTALMLGRAVQEVRPEAELTVGRSENGKRSRTEVGIHSLRMGNTVGWHEVIINTGTQILTLRHEAQDRALFAEGALSAARFLVGKKPGLYAMKDMVKV